MQLVRVPDGNVVAARVEGALDSATRRKGLLGRDALAADAALIIAPCSAVHTFFMRFAIDVVFVSRDGRVLKIAPAVVPWRTTGSLRAYAVIELAAGSAARAELRAGDQLALVPAILQPR